MIEILLLIAGYFGLLALLSWAATPARRRIKDLGTQLLQLDLTDYERAYIQGCMRHAYSWRAAVGLLLGYISGMFETEQTLEAKMREAADKYPTLRRDWRLYALFECYIASAFAVNPIVGIAVVVFRTIYRWRVRIHHNAKRTKEIVDLRGMSASV